ncbi:shikimate dehydrogenase family protein [Dysgonomonas sp.]|jgi:shikimate dehydrogenase|nr:shikimate dehydrogenase [Prevotella sp.]
MDTYGLIGYPLKHSFSRAYFTEKFAKEEIDAIYLNFEIENISLFTGIIESQPTLKGLNVTLPYKEQVIPFLDEIDPRAQTIGAVNVIKILRENGKVKLTGYNSDIIGFQNSISPLIDKNVHTKALILGTGGASKAVLNGLKAFGIESVLVSRTPNPEQLSYLDIDQDIINNYKVIVNTSPLGTFPNVEDAPDIPYHLLSNGHVLYDLVYNPAETKFLRLGKQQGATIKNGAEMLELQARAAWEIWNG